MNFGSIVTIINEKVIKNLFTRYILILIFCFTLAILLNRYLWSQNISLFHTIFEIASVFVAISIFSVVWHNYDYVSEDNRIIGFGFLAVAVFDIFHTYFYPTLKFQPEGYDDLTTRYWILGRFIEGIVMLLVSYNLIRFKINRWVGLLVSLVFAVGISHVILLFPNTLPVLFTVDSGVTNTKVLLEYVVIFMFIVSLYKLFKRADGRDTLPNNHIFLALLLAIPTELCFTLYKNTTSFYALLGHILKVTYYYFFFKAIFVFTITYPYRKLEQTSKRMRDILNQLPIGLTTFNNNLKVDFSNKKSLEILKCQEDYILGLSCDEITSKFNSLDNDNGRLLDQFTENSNSIKNKIRIVKTAAGDSLKLKVDLHKLDDGGLLYLFNEAKKEQELENLQLQTQTILNSLSNSVCMTDKNCRIVMCNKAFEEIFEVEAKDILGMDKDELDKLIELKTRKVSSHHNNYRNYDIYEAAFTTPNGNKKEKMLHTSIIKDIDGEVIGRISIGTDITELKKEQRKIQQQEKLALIGQMGASIVHETKNLLSVIKGCCQLITLKVSDEYTRKYIGKIETVSEDVNKVLCDFLSLSKPRTLNLNELSINDIIESSKFAITSSALIKGVDTRIILSEEEKTVMCDEVQIKQVLLNVVKNAVEALTEVDKPLLVLETQYNRLNDSMNIIIKDNGRGISEEDLLKLGTPFHTTKDKGTGLGLSVCYQIMREHMGEIDVESALGKGTTFTISIPCIDKFSLSNIS